MFNVDQGIEPQINANIKLSVTCSVALLYHSLEYFI